MNLQVRLLHSTSSLILCKNVFSRVDIYKIVGFWNKICIKRKTNMNRFSLVSNCFTFTPWFVTPRVHKIITSVGSRISQRGCANPRGGTNILFDQFFPKTAWKWKKFGPEGGEARPCAPLDPPLITSKYYLYFDFHMDRIQMSMLTKVPQNFFLPHWPIIGFQ